MARQSRIPYWLAMADAFMICYLRTRVLSHILKKGSYLDAACNSAT
jgi:hypothetical protein